MTAGFDFSGDWDSDTHTLVVTNRDGERLNVGDVLRFGRTYLLVSGLPEMDYGITRFHLSPIGIWVKCLRPSSNPDAFGRDGTELFTIAEHVPAISTARLCWWCPSSVQIRVGDTLETEGTALRHLVLFARERRGLTELLMQETVCASSVV
ncbi:hypothetical protein KP005_16835 [Geomonas nitrogeniifigens]|uniref:Uncharacterized protein n=1 Tax=Geomonas diazotrophica TaxID=2843197 RepID=A0ABX8JF30_9BACT|nr:hypothetical protein [Geomonas nitrogeniifigens]QWV96994.1 hypothetical protein KP005_16835 [Geomonas nitrogeniifigens]